jgi:plastocyanin
MKLITLRGLAMAAALLLHPGLAHAQELNVTIDNFTFSPPELKVKVGDTVTWTNHDDIPHTVVSAGKFRSKAMTRTTASRSPSPLRVTTSIFARCTRT